MKISAPIASLAGVPDFPPRPRVRLISLLLAVITILVYLPAGFYDFINFDDNDYVVENPFVLGGLTWAGLKWAFIGWHASNWHPLTWLSLQLDCQLFGLNPCADHIINVLFHAANAVLLFHLWLRLTKACWPSAMVAALFAWHPLHVESVAWIAERKDVLSTFFGLLALLSYALYVEKSAAQKTRVAAGKGASPMWYGASLAMFALSLLAKPMLVTLPFLLLLLDYWPLGRLCGGRGWRAEAGRLAWEKAPFFLVAVLSCGCTYLAQQGHAVQSLAWVPAGLRLENVAVSYAGYLGDTLFPFNLCIYYPLPAHYPAVEVVALTGLLLALSALAWRYREKRCLLTGWLWFLGTLVPVIGLVQVGLQARADRYTYLPIVGLFAATTFALTEALRRWQIAAWPIRIAAALILGACVLATEHQLSFWRNTETLFTRAVAVTKNNGLAHMHLSLEFKAHGRDAESRQEYQKAMDCYALTLVPVAGGRKQSLAAQLEMIQARDGERHGNREDAIGHYREALRWDPDFAEAHDALALLLEQDNQPAEALGHFQAAVRLRPEISLAHKNLANQLAEMGQFSAAAREYQEAARLAPADGQAAFLLGKALLRNGQGDEAVAAFQQALAINSNDCPSLAYLARVRASDETPQLRNGPEAVTLAESANSLTGGKQPFVLGTLAMAYAETGRFAEAQQAAQAALALAQAAGAAPDIVSNLQARVRLYEAGQPFRESFTNPPVP